MARALRPTQEERLIREFVLQLKLGSVRPSYFAAKYADDVLLRYREPLAELSAEGFLTTGPDRVTLTRAGLLRVDSLLPRFSKPEHATVRYT